MSWTTEWFGNHSFVSSELRCSWLHLEHLILITSSAFDEEFCRQSCQRKRNESDKHLDNGIDACNSHRGSNVLWSLLYQGHKVYDQDGAHGRSLLHIVSSHLLQRNHSNALDSTAIQGTLNANRTEAKIHAFKNAPCISPQY